jgi:hypothetical protein
MKANAPKTIIAKPISLPEAKMDLTFHESVAVGYKSGPQSLFECDFHSQAARIGMGLSSA